MQLLKSSLKVYFAFFRKDLTSNYASLAALVVGISCFLLLVTYADSELHYDTHFDDFDRLYRINQDVFLNNKLTDQLPVVLPQVGPLLKDEFPEIESFVRFYRFVSTSVGYKQDVFIGDKIYGCDNSAIDLFSLKFIKGDPQDALLHPNSVILTKTMAQKLFGTENPVGELLKISNVYNNYNCQVTGVIEDLPANMHMEIDVLLSLSTLFEHAIWNTDYMSLFYTYVKITENGSVENVRQKLQQFKKDNFEWYLDKDSKNDFNLSLEPINEIYLYSDYQYSTKKGNLNQVTFLLILAFGIFIISLFNFVNLTNAKFILRKKEIFTRIVLGSSKLKIIFHLIVENFLFLFSVLLISASLVVVVIKKIPSIFNVAIENIMGSTFNYLFIALFICIAVSSLASMVSLLALNKDGLSSATKKSDSKTVKLIQNFSIAIQYAVSIIFILASIVFARQVEFMSKTDLNMNIDNVLFSEAPILENNSSEKLSTLKQLLKSHPEVLDVAYSRNMVGKEVRNYRYFPLNKINKDYFKSVYLGTDESFINTFEIKLLAGRGFEKGDNQGDLKKVIINESTVNLLGYENINDCVGEIFTDNRMANYEIIGVIKDYYHEFLNEELYPLSLYYREDKPKWISVRVAPGTMQRAQQIIREEWAKFYPISLLNMGNLREYQKLMSNNEIFIAEKIPYVTIILLILLVYGTFALSYFEITNRKRECAIRMILGSSDKELFTLLSKKYFYTLLLVTAISLPLAIYWINQWLTNFSKRISISWLDCLIPALVISVVLIVIMLYNTIQVKNTDLSSTIKNID